ASLQGLVFLAGTLYAQTSVSSQEIKNVNATADVTVNATLPAPAPTFKLSGTISGTAVFFVAVTAQSTNGSSTFSGSVDASTKKYSVMVPAGTYILSVSYIASLSGGPSISNYRDPTPVQVSGDTTRDITIAPVVTHSISGVISNLDARFSTTILLFTPS